MPTRDAAVLIVGIGLIGATPLLMLAVWLLRRRASVPDRSVEQRSHLRGVAISLGLIALVAGLAAWWVSGGTSPARSADPMAAPNGMQGMAGAAPTSGSTPMAPPLLPATLAGMPLRTSSTGGQAISQIASMHPASFPVAGAQIATYSSDRASATVWVALESGQKSATLLTAEMAGAMAKGSSPFDPPTRSPSGVWATTGMGQDHYFFASGKEVWWISADPSVASSALADLLKVPPVHLAASPDGS